MKEKELMESKHIKLIEELNELCIALKIHLHDVSTTDEHLQLLKRAHPIPSVEDIDTLQLKLKNVLSQDAKPL